MRVLGCFDHAFVINLSTDRDRMENTRAQLAAVGIPFERREGITACKLLPPKGANRLGCLLTHLAIVREARRRRYGSVVVIEDDIVLRPQFLDLWADVSPSLRSLRYDLLYFYRWKKRVPEHRPLNLVAIDGTLCTHFYAVHSRFYDRYIHIVERQLANPRPKAIDLIFSSKAVRIFATSYNLVGQNAGPSRISLRPRPKIRFE